MTSKTLQRGFLFSLFMLVAITLSVRFIDRPLAEALAETHLARAWLVGPEVQWPVLEVLSYAALVIGVAHLVVGRPLPRWTVAGMLAGLALVVSLALVENVLKPIFGRTVPSVLLKSGRGGFHWFRYGGALQSFPSGHSDQAAAILTVLWHYYPRGRWLYIAAVVLLAIALMLGEWHFLGDIVAGCLVGVWVGVIVQQGWAAVTARANAPPQQGS